jgi:hypothetical protein
LSSFYNQSRKAERCPSYGDDVATHLAIETPQGTPRRQLRKLDGLLDALEELNMNDMTCVPTRVGGDLQHYGVVDPYRCSIPELIDKVFELQQPLLERLRAHSRPGRSH